MSSAVNIDSPYAIDEKQRRFFQENGYIKLRRVLTPETLSYFGEHITQQVIERNTQHRPMAERNTYERAFLQVTNLWRTDPVVETFVRSKRLARMAAELMGVRGVRLYHDQALYKEPGGGITPWHADQYYWPLSTDNTCTAWIPLQETSEQMGPLSFAAGSHHFEAGRDLAISDASQSILEAALKAQALREERSSFELGEVSFHYGWTFHHTGPNSTDRARAVMTIIYMEEGIRLLEPARPEHVADRDAFMPGIAVGEQAASVLNPLLWSSADAG